ncbi:MAG: VOC family protein [Ilumatobacter sp.]|nr:VOC family protein [Ilumatobacter sp.]
MSTDVVPIFRVTDAAAAVDWYRRLGFEQVFEHRFAPDMPAYVGIKRDDAQIHLSEHAGDALHPGLAYVWVDAVDPLAALFDATVDEMPWARDFEVSDPDGNRLRLAEPVAAES